MSVRSAPCALLDHPTATQRIVVGQATPVSQLNTAPLRAGTGLRSHLVPFHRTTKARVVPATVELPTAAQRSAVAHDTAASRERVAPAGFGLATIDQLVPFQRSMNAL